MKQKLSDIRSDYTSGSLDVNDLDKNPINQFNFWLDQAIELKLPEPTAFTLATVGAGGTPSARVVLLKEVTDLGFSFFTNYNSEKGLQLIENPIACMNFCWLDVHRQVRLTGKVTKCDEAVSEAYFNSRPVGSRIAAIVSAQSEEVESREELEQRYADLAKADEATLKKPAHWGGFVIQPKSVEFWQGRPNRLHDRFRYTLLAAEWKIVRLQP